MYRAGHDGGDFVFRRLKVTDERAPPEGQRYAIDEDLIPKVVVGRASNVGTRTR